MERSKSTFDKQVDEMRLDGCHDGGEGGEAHLGEEQQASV